MKQIVSILFIFSFAVTTVFGQCRDKSNPNWDDRHNHFHDRDYYQPRRQQPRPQQQPRQQDDQRKKRNRYDRLHLQVGGAGSYLYDQSNETGFDPQAERVDGFAEGMIGLRFDIRGRRGRRANVLAGWGTVGVLSPQSVRVLLAEQGVAGGVDASAVSYQYQEMEAGFLFKEWFRLSGGVGMLEYQDLSGAVQTFNYYKATSGFSIGLTRAIKWNTYATVLVAEGGSNFTFRPSTGLSFRFNFLRI